MRRILFLLFWISGTLLLAQELTIERCREMALENNRTLKGSSLQHQIAKEQLGVYKTNYLPRFSVTGNYLYSTGNTTLSIPGGYLPTFVPNATTGQLEPNLTLLPNGELGFKEYAYMPGMDFDLKISSVFSAGIQVEQPIYMGGKIHTSIQMAKIGVEMASLLKSKDEKEVIAKTDEAYWNFLQVEELHKSAKKYHEVVSAFYRQMENGYRCGMKTKNDLLKVQVRLNEAELKLRQTENGISLARMNLCHYIGLPLSTTTLQITDTFSDETLESHSEESIDARPEYEMLVKQVDLKKQNIRLARSEFLPEIAAVASYNYVNGIQLNHSTLFNQGAFLGGVTLRIPVFHWGEGHKKVAIARLEKEQAQNQLEELSEAMQLELQQALNRFDEASLEVSLTQRSLQQAEENMTVSGNQYTAGMETLTDYLESQALWQKAMSDFTNARARKRLAYTQYLKASGKL